MMTTKVTIEACAKVNLTLEVFGERADGYHAIRSLVVPVSLSDTLEIAPSDTLSSDSGYPDDLVLKAARALDPSRGAAIHVVKRIPAGGGLGGGSADAAAALVALNGLWGLGLSRDELVARGAAVGSDVPALVLGAPAVMEGRGETVSRATCLRLELVIVNPGVSSSTREVYAHCTPRGASAPSATADCLAALASGDLDRIARSFCNDLSSPAQKLYPEISNALDALRTTEAKGVSMTGSGSSVFGLFASAREALEAVDALKSKGFSAWAVHTTGQDMV